MPGMDGFELCRTLRRHSDVPIVMLPTRHVLTAALFASLSPFAFGQADRPTGKINEIYTQLCANCHGKNLEGGQAQSMLDDVWVAGGDEESLAKSIRQGFPDIMSCPRGSYISPVRIQS